MEPIIYTSDFSKRHDTGLGHPECAARITALEDLFAKAPFKDWPQKTGLPADEDQILFAHHQDYMDRLLDLTPEDNLTAIDGDTILSPDSYDAALHAAGTICLAVDDIYLEKNRYAFCATRPPGHHAEPNTAMGFCLFNNVFIGARHAQEKYGVKKIAIIDFDVHHGNGTETMCRHHNKKNTGNPIFYISSHGHPLFPMTGNPQDNDKNLLNLYLPNHCGSDEFRALYENQVFPALQSFTPDLLMISAGFDAHKDDPLAGINLETEDYGWVTKNLRQNCPKNTPIISVLEGGYHLEALKNGVEAHLLGLQGE